MHNRHADRESRPRGNKTSTKARLQEMPLSKWIFSGSVTHQLSSSNNHVNERVNNHFVAFLTAAIKFVERQIPRFAFADRRR